MKNAGGKNSTKIPVLGDIPILGALFRSDADVDRQVNVVIYITPYIVKKSGDLKRLRTALVELEEIQTKYNRYVRKGLDKKSGYDEDAEKEAVPASRRIRRNKSNIDNLSILDEEE